MSVPPPPVVRLRGVSKRYRRGDGEVCALDRIDLEVARGEYVRVLGPSGSGKTTLLEILGCLSRPTAGTYELDGRRVDACDDRALAAVRGERIGFVFQTFNLVPRLTAVENVELPLLYRRVGRRERRERALALLARVGLSARARHRPSELSGGERQRVAIARALVNRPSMLLADEPTGSLDSATGARVLALLEELRDEGRTLVLVTHDPSLGAGVARAVWLRDGALDCGDARAE